MMFPDPNTLPSPKLLGHPFANAPRNLRILIPSKKTVTAPCRLPTLPTLSILANRRGSEGCPTPRPASRTSPWHRDRRRGARTACPDATFSDGFQDNAIRLWAAGELGAEDSSRSGCCGGGARASCDGGKGACRCRLCEARVEETILGLVICNLRQR